MMGLAPRRLGLAWLLGVLWLSAACPGPLMAQTSVKETVVHWLSPPAETSLFDSVVMEVAVTSMTPVERVEFFIDGERVGVVSERPYRIQIDVGPENRDRWLEAWVYAPHGPLAKVEQLASAVVIDEAVELDLQQLFVTVSDRRGNRRLDLQADDFSVQDSGEPQELVTFASGEIPFNAVLLIDGSFSMSGGPLQAALQGARHFVDRMAEHDRAKVMVYSDHLVGSTAWAEQADELASSLAAVRANGGSALLDHLFLGLELLELEPGRRVLILLSDGWDLHSVLDAEQMARRARRSQAVVYWVQLGVAGSPQKTSGRSPIGWVGNHAGKVTHRRMASSTWRDDDASQRIFEVLHETVIQSGGRVVEVQASGGIEAAFLDILQELREQYALGYYPHARQVEEPWRRVRVNVDPRGLELRTRKGYIDRRSRP